MCALDVADIDAFAHFGETVGAALVDRFGRSRFDYLVNNAGVGVHAPLVDTAQAQSDDIGRAVAAILSDDLAWANGTSFDVSGGQKL